MTKLKLSKQLDHEHFVACKSHQPQVKVLVISTNNTENDHLLCQLHALSNWNCWVCDICYFSGTSRIFLLHERWSLHITLDSSFGSLSCLTSFAWKMKSAHYIQLRYHGWDYFNGPHVWSLILKSLSAIDMLLLILNCS